MTTDIPDWMTAQTFHPQLTISSGATDTVVAAVSHELQRVGYKVQASSPAETRLRHRDWFAIASGNWASTELVLVASVGSVLIEVTRGADNRKARTLGRQALNAALASLREQDAELVVGPWHKAP